MTEEARFIHIKGLFKSYSRGRQTVEVLSGLDLDVARATRWRWWGPREWAIDPVAYSGHPGSPTGGQVLVEGRDPFQMGEAELAAFRNRHIGFVFQFHHLLPEFNAWKTS